MKKALSIVLKVLLVIVIAIVLAVVILTTVTALEGADKASVAGSEDWMQRLSDDLLISDVTLPGTHDSATQYVQLSFFSKCQSLNIGEQLDAGYRYLDIRLGASDDGLILMHGFTKCKKSLAPWSEALTLDDVLKQCDSFLKEHPSECIVFAVKQEHGDESVAEFEQMLDAVFAVYDGLLLPTGEIPTVGEARGHIVLMRRYDDEAGLGDRSGIPFIWAKQNGSEVIDPAYAEEDNDSYMLRVQDRYEYVTDDKWEAFTSSLTGGDICIDFLSTKGKLTYGHPHKYAKVLNKRLMEYDLSAADGTWIIVDFASPKLAQKIWECN